MTRAQLQTLVDVYGLTPASLASGLSWTAALAALLVHAFLHDGVLHLLMNMMLFVQAGPFVETRLGSLRFAVLYLVAILGGAAAYIMINPDSARSAIGASGAVCGVFAAYFLAVRPTPRAALSDARVRNAMLSFVGVNVVLMALLPLPIAWEAHLGGFIAGGVAYLMMAPRVPAGPWS
jgi:membrane associated rhomboid family serine protease